MSTQSRNGYWTPIRKFLERRDGNALVWRDGKRMTIDDGQGAKTPAARLDAPDLKDMLTTPYPLGEAPPPALDSDPGRARNSAFFLAMYGDCEKGGVSANLVPVVWLPKKWGKTLQVTRINGVAERLAAVSAELDKLPARFDTYLVPAGRHLQLPTHRRHDAPQPARSRHRDRHRDEAHRLLALEQAGQRRPLSLTAIASPPRSSRSSRSTASSGAASGTTTIRCTSSIGRSLLPPR